MVDKSLPINQRDRSLRYLFLDLNSYFASVEQQERPELRGRPVAVGAVEADTSFVIAASYEAKAYGVKTGTMIGDAKAMCPDLTMVQARSTVYVAYHQRILEVLDAVLPIEQVCSIDEMRFRLLGEERSRENAIEMANRLKQALCEGVGECIRCSIGIAPNPFLAKVGTELQKPDGLVVLESDDLPHRLFSLKLTDFPGINKRMKVRLNAAGIFTTEQMCAATKDELRRAFGSIIGERWWYQLQGFELTPEPTERKTLGHSHVLPPNLRHRDGCREVMLRLIGKAMARLRANELTTAHVTFYVQGFRKSWSDKLRINPTQDTLTLNEAFLSVWSAAKFEMPRSVGVTLSELQAPEEVTPSLFEQVAHRQALNEALDEVNAKFGKNAVFLAGMAKVRDTASEKIAFNKTWLFQEGKGDNDWMPTFRDLTNQDT